MNWGSFPGAEKFHGPRASLIFAALKPLPMAQPTPMRSFRCTSPFRTHSSSCLVVAVVVVARCRCSLNNSAYPFSYSPSFAFVIVVVILCIGPSYSPSSVNTLRDAHHFHLAFLFRLLGLFSLDWAYRSHRQLFSYFLFTFFFYSLYFSSICWVSFVLFLFFLILHLHLSSSLHPVHIYICCIESSLLAADASVERECF